MIHLAEVCLFAVDFVLIQELHCASVGMAEDKPLISLLKPEHGSVGAAGCKPRRGCKLQFWAE